jgi:hypothetical protein
MARIASTASSARASATRREGRTNPARPQIADLDSLPWPGPRVDRPAALHRRWAPPPRLWQPDHRPAAPTTAAGARTASSGTPTVGGAPPTRGRAGPHRGAVPTGPGLVRRRCLHDQSPLDRRVRRSLPGAAARPRDDLPGRPLAPRGRLARPGRDGCYRSGSARERQPRHPMRWPAA